MSKELTVEETRPALWDPLRDFRRMTGMSELFGDLFEGVGLPSLRFPAIARAWEPRVNIKEDGKCYEITAALPGVKKEDVKISMQGGILTLSGEYKEEKEEKSKSFIRNELTQGSFQRSFILPSYVHPEDVKASFKDGLLTVALPKKEEKPRGVSIKVD